MASRSLGTLTLDLVARVGGFTAGLSKAERDAKQWGKQIRKEVNAVGKNFAAAGAVVAGAVAAITVSTARHAVEVARLSQLSNTATGDFQRYAAGAKAMGVEQDKLADIFKDTTDKVGDFLQTGGGPLADFFENIAPKIGVTAEEFRNLSGPQALELYVSSLEKANVSQNEMTFFMEAIASDATMLLPLLRDNAAGFKLYGDEAERLGVILDSSTIKESQRLAAATMLLEMSTWGLKNQIATALIPAMAGYSAALTEVSADKELVAGLSADLAKNINAVAVASVGAFASVQLLTKGVETLWKVRAASREGGEWWENFVPALAVKRAIENRDAIVAAMDEGGEDLQEIALRYATLLNKIEDVESGGGGASAERESLLDRMAELMGGIDEASRGAAISVATLSDETERNAEKVAEQIAAFQLEARVLGMTNDEVKLLKLSMMDATPEQLRLARAALATKSAFEANNKAQSDYRELLLSLRTDEERLTDQLNERLAVMEQIKDLSDQERSQVASRIAADAFQNSPGFGGISPEIGGPAGELLRINDAQSELDEWYQTQLDQLAKFREDKAELNSIWDEQEIALREEHEQRIADIQQARNLAQMAAAEDLFGNLADISKEFAGEQSGIFKTLFAIEKAAAVARSIVAIQAGIAQAAAAPFPANIAAMAAVAAQTASIVGNIRAVTLAGQAHDGIDRIPKTGTFLLEEGERVVTAPTSARLDQTLDEVEQSMRTGEKQGGDSSALVIHNSFDVEESIDSWADSSRGDRHIMNVVRKNAATIRALTL